MEVKKVILPLSEPKKGFWVLARPGALGFKKVNWELGFLVSKSTPMFLNKSNEWEGMGKKRY